MAEVKNRQAWYTTLQKLLLTVKSFNADTITSGDIKTHLESADRIWNKIDAYHTKLLDAAVDEASATLQQDALAPMEKCYNDVKTTLYNLKTSPSTSHSKGNVKLPKLELQTFSGKYEDWMPFKDSFIATIDGDTSLAGSQKLQYLKGCVKGEAHSHVKSFAATDANYKEAWDLLQKHYENQREIVHSHVKKLVFQPAIKQESLSSLKQMLTTTLESLRSLKVLGRPTDSWDDIITVILIDKFDNDTKAEWAKSLKGTSVPTFQELHDFIEQHIRTLHAKGSVKQQSTAVPANARKVNVSHSSASSCSYCKDTHQLYQCAQLKEMSAEKRVAAVKALQVCLNCLKDGHISKDCQSSGRCRKCDKKHNTFLHMDGQRKAVNSSSHHHGDGSSGSSSSSQPSSSTNIRINSSGVLNSATLLKTALVDVLDSSQVKTSLRVFIDEGAEGGLIRESSMHSLGLRKERANVTITGVGGTTATTARWKTYVKLYSKINNCSIDVELLAVPQVTGVINRVPEGNPRRWSHIAGLQLADPHFQQGGEVDILLGSDVAPYIIKQGLRKSHRNAPVAQETIFGWVLFGNVSHSPQQSIKINNFTCTISETLQKFWALEDVADQPSLTREETKCEQHFLQTHRRQPDGRYIVNLPFNEKKDQLGESRSQAYRRLLSLERRFNKHPQYKQAYIDFMREYEQLGHMEKVSSNNNENCKFYLPHHFVLKEDSTTTKQRTVFDGSAKSSTGVSLNDVLMVGATVQPDLYTLLLRFRYNKIALKADVAKMYRQFLIDEADRDYQRICGEKAVINQLQNTD